MNVPQNTRQDDQIVPFAVEELDIRGRVVRLGASIDKILRRHAYPESVARVVGEAVVLAALLGSSLKLEGSFQVQTKSDGPVDRIVVDFTAPGMIRAYARFDKDAVFALGTGVLKTFDLLGKGILALTIDPGGDLKRYQGIVELGEEGFEGAADLYFRQSEQIPTRVRLAVAEQFENGQQHFRAGGMIIQFLPSSEERMKKRQESREEAVDEADILDLSEEDNNWTEARLLCDTIEDHELVDPVLSSEELLYRLYHEQGVRVFPAETVHEECRCSRERVMKMLLGFSQEDRDAMQDDAKHIGVTCEFCSRHYDFTAGELESATVE